MAREHIHGREIIIEYHTVGAFIKVSAMDVSTLTEVSIQGPATAAQELLQRNAVKRLEYVLKKRGIL